MYYIIHTNICTYIYTHKYTHIYKYICIYIQRMFQALLEATDFAIDLLFTLCGHKSVLHYLKLLPYSPFQHLWLPKPYACLVPWSKTASPSSHWHHWTWRYGGSDESIWVSGSFHGCQFSFILHYHHVPLTFQVPVLLTSVLCTTRICGNRWT